MGEIPIASFSPGFEQYLSSAYFTLSTVVAVLFVVGSDTRPRKKYMNILTSYLLLYLHLKEAALEKNDLCGLTTCRVQRHPSMEVFFAGSA